MKKLISLICICGILFVGCGSSKIKIVGEKVEKTARLGIHGAMNSLMVDIEIQEKKDNMVNLYDVIRPIDEYICEKINIDRYSVAIINIYDTNGDMLGFINMTNIKGNIVYDLTPMEGLGDSKNDISIK